jgi:hypothetical protein
MDRKGIAYHEAMGMRYMRLRFGIHETKEWATRGQGMGYMRSRDEIHEAKGWDT